MITFYVIYDEFNRQFLRAGRGVFYTLSLNSAKHFTSEWSAQQFMKNCSELECMKIKKIQRY